MIRICISVNRGSLRISSTLPLNIFIWKIRFSNLAQVSQVKHRLWNIPALAAIFSASNTYNQFKLEKQKILCILFCFVCWFVCFQWVRRNGWTKRLLYGQSESNKMPLDMWILDTTKEIKHFSVFNAYTVTQFYIFRKEHFQIFTRNSFFKCTTFELWLKTSKFASDIYENTFLLIRPC